tara:strand:+ start:67 stop:222 length:156 start_codon:yes stop_codon:yes gene_type:complete
MPYNPKTNKYENTTRRLNRERTHEVRDPNTMTAAELLREAGMEVIEWSKTK